MADPEIIGPPFTWTLFKRNVRLWLTWSYIFSFLAMFALPMGLIILFPKQTDDYLDWFDDPSTGRARSWDKALSFAVYFGIPLPSLLLTWRHLKASGYRYINNSPGNKLYLAAIFAPAIVSSWPWIRDRVPWYLEEALRVYSIVGVHIGFMSTHTFCLSDFENSTENKRTERAVLELFGKREAILPRRLQWEGFKQYAMQNLNRPVERTMILLSMFSLIAVLFEEPGSKKIKFGGLELSWWIGIPYMVMLLGPPMIFPFIATYRLINTLKEAGYEKTNEWISMLIMFAELQCKAVVSTWIYETKQVWLIVLFWIGSFAISYGAVWSNAWTLKAAVDKKLDLVEELHTQQE